MSSGQKGFFLLILATKNKESFSFLNAFVVRYFSFCFYSFHLALRSIYFCLKDFFFLNFKCFYTYLSAITKRSSFFVRLEIRKEEKKTIKAEEVLLWGKLEGNILIFTLFLFLACVLFFHPLFFTFNTKLDFNICDSLKRYQRNSENHLIEAL